MGTSVAEAFYTMYLLERACAMQVAALAGGAQLHYPAPEVQDVVRKQAARGLTGNDVKLAWDALLRMLDVKDPSYKN